MRDEEIRSVEKLWGPLWEPMEATFLRTLAGYRMWSKRRRKLEIALQGGEEMINEKTLRRLKEIEERAAKATPGPWKTYKYIGVWPIKGPPPGDEGGNFERQEDAEFIAHARMDVPWLCEVVRHLIAENATMRELLKRRKHD